MTKEWEKPEDLRRRKPEVHQLISLELHIDPLQTAQRVGGVALHNSAERNCVAGTGEYFSAESVVDIPEQIFFPERNVIAGGRQFAEQFSFFYG